MLEKTKLETITSLLRFKRLQLKRFYFVCHFFSHSPRNHSCTRRLRLGDLSYVHWPSTRGEAFVNSGIICKPFLCFFQFWVQGSNNCNNHVSRVLQFAYHWNQNSRIKMWQEKHWKISLKQEIKNHTDSF